MIKENTTFDGVTVSASGDTVQVRTRIAILREGIEIDAHYHHYCIDRGDDYSTEAEQVKKICAALWD
jgi:hypothetical protein